jgi:hypothetical protein
LRNQENNQSPFKICARFLHPPQGFIPIAVVALAIFVPIFARVKHVVSSWPIFRGVV